MSDYRKAADAKRRADVPWRRWYNTRAWKTRSAKQLRREPLCRLCAALGRTKLAAAADHVIPHRGDRRLFFYGDLQSLCDTCHSSAKQREERDGFSRDIGADGWPVDPRHPFNSRQKRE